MSIKSPKGIYNILEKYLRAAATDGGGGPLTVTMLMDIDEVRRAALEEFTQGGKDVRTATNKLSDTLGFMWRRGLLTRYPAPKESNSFARYSYVWDEQEYSHPITENPINRIEAKKLGINVTEIDGGVHLDFPTFSVTIKGKA